MDVLSLLWGYALGQIVCFMIVFTEHKLTIKKLITELQVYQAKKEGER